MAERLAETRQRSSERVAHRVQAIVGVSVFPDPGEGPRALRADSQFPPDAGGPSARLPRLRLAADFEELRQRSDARLAASGKRPCVFLASMGPLAAHTARSTWAANLLAAGGFEAVSGDGFPDAAAAAAAFAAIGLRAAVVCASDAFLDEALPAVVKALREAGAKRVVVAAPPRPSLADAGADAFVHRGSDALAFLRSLWEEEAER
ncbi:MAG: hypothetical protein D6731_12990 [Planctomycetota bacterium]|nr:MAG: hypothetical protein D6731_12990 [Planctomycetota bacterium]